MVKINYLRQGYENIGYIYEYTTVFGFENIIEAP